MLAVGAYGGVALYRGNLDDLLRELATEKGFLVWASALGIVYALYQAPSVHPIGKGILGLTVAGLALKVSTNQHIIAALSAAASLAQTTSEGK